MYALANMGHPSRTKESSGALKIRQRFQFGPSVMMHNRLRGFQIHVPHSGILADGCIPLTTLQSLSCQFRMAEFRMACR
jgi:hypothetical protein